MNNAGRRMFLSVDLDETLNSTEAKVAVGIGAGATIAAYFFDALPGIGTFLAGLAAFIASCTQFYFAHRRNKRQEERQELLIESVTEGLDNYKALGRKIELESPVIQRIQSAMRDSRRGKKPLESFQELQKALAEFERLDK